MPPSPFAPWQAAQWRPYSFAPSDPAMAEDMPRPASRVAANTRCVSIITPIHEKLNHIKINTLVYFYTLMHAPGLHARPARSFRTGGARCGRRQTTVPDYAPSNRPPWRAACRNQTPPPRHALIPPSTLLIGWSPPHRRKIRQLNDVYLETHHGHPRHPHPQRSPMQQRRRLRRAGAGSPAGTRRRRLRQGVDGPRGGRLPVHQGPGGLRHRLQGAGRAGSRRGTAADRGRLLHVGRGAGRAGGSQVQGAGRQGGSGGRL